MKMSYSRYVLAVLGASVAGVLAAVAARGEGLQVTLSAPAPVIAQTATGAQVKIPGFGNGAIAGQPRMPRQVFRIAVPPDIDWSTLKLKSATGTPQTLALPAPVAPAAPSQPNAANRAAARYPIGALVVNGMDMSVYGQDSLYPAAPATLLARGEMRKWKFAQVQFNPVQWNPATGAAQYWPQVQVELEFERQPVAAGAPSAADDPALADTAMDDVAAQMLVNYSEAAAWYRPSAAGQRGYDGPPKADYVILTSTYLKNQLSNLQTFVNHKTAMGHTVAVITEADFGSTVGPFPNETEDKARAWLRNNYMTMGIVWVLLIGDPTPVYNGGTGKVPMKMSWPRYGETDNVQDSPTDMYYSDLLSSTWDPWLSGYAGKYSDYLPGVGVSLIPQLYVGRIPCYAENGWEGDINTANNVLQKIMDYDNQANTSWRKSALLPMSFSAPGYDGAPLAEQMWDDFLHGAGYSRWRMYERGNAPCGDTSGYPSDQEIRAGTVLPTRWAAHPVGLLCWWGHGNQNNAKVGYGTDHADCWDGDMITSYQLAGLDNQHPAFTFQNSCLNGYPENYENLGVSLLQQGAIATVSASRDSFFSTGDGYGDFNTTAENSGLAYQYCRYLTAGNPAGKALALAKVAALAYMSDEYTFMNQMDFNLYGDPTSQMAQPVQYFPLADHQGWPMTAVPRRYSFAVNNASWAAVAIRPATEDHDLRADTQVGLPSPYAVSAMSGVTPDFVVANGHSLGAGAHYAEVYKGGETPYAIEAATASSTIALENWVTRANTNKAEVLDKLEAAVTAGRTYEVTLDGSADSADFMLFVFDPSRQSGTRTDFDAGCNNHGRYGTETLTYTPAASGYMCVLAINLTGDTGTYKVRVRDITPVAAPVLLIASDGSYPDHVALTWSTVSGAASYQVYRGLYTNAGLATALTGWITSNNYSDFTATAGTAYYYFVKAAADDTGYRAGDFSTGDLGYVSPPTITSDVRTGGTNTPAFFQFAQPNAYWAAVAVRPNASNDYWAVQLDSSPSFTTPLVAASFYMPVNFIVVDRNHAPNVTEGIKIYELSSPQTTGASLEFDGGAETWSLGTNANVAWPAGEIIKMRDIYLTNGSYRVELDLTAGAANLDVALFGSGDGNYYRHREQYLARSIRLAGPQVFYVNLTNAAYYGLCVWANDTNSATYNLSINPVTAGLWDGTVSDDWHTAANWNNNTVPTAGTDVNIPAGRPHNPRIWWQTGVCSNLTIQAGASLTVTNMTLNAGGDARIHGALNLASTSSLLHLGGTIYWESGSTATTTGSARIQVTGDWNFELGARVQLTSGFVEFIGAGVSTIRAYDPNCYLYNLAVSKYSPAYLAISDQSVSDFLVHNIYLYSGTEFHCNSSFNVVISGFMNNLGGIFQWSHGGAVFTGDPSVAPLAPTAASYFNNLTHSGTGPLVLAASVTNFLTVNGDLTINSNLLDSGSLELRVAGSWYNNVGSAGFLCRTGAVTFTGWLQTVNGSNVFNTVWDKRTGSRGALLLNDDIVVTNALHVSTFVEARGHLDVRGTLDLNTPAATLAVYDGANVTAQLFDQGGLLLMYGGQFTAADLADNGIFGAYNIQGGAATLQQDAAGFVDLDAVVNISGGSLRVVGGSSATYSDWPYATNASLTMSGGVLDFDGSGIRIGQFTTYKLTNNITGGRIRTSGSFLVADPAFTLAGGDVELYGPVSRTLTQAPGGSLHNLIINKSAANINPTTNVVLAGDFTLASGTFTAPAIMTVGGSWTDLPVPSGFLEGVGAVLFNGTTPATVNSSETFYTLTVNKPGATQPALQIADAARVGVTNTLTCAAGTLALGAGSVLDVRGDLTLSRGAGLNATNTVPALFLGGNWINHNTNRTDLVGFAAGASSRVTFDGSASATLSLDSGTEEFQDVVVNRPGGALRPMNSVNVDGQLSISNGYWSSFVGGLQHHLQGNVYVDTPGAWGDSAASITVWFSGANNATITYAGTNGYLPNIAINKTGGAGVVLQSDLVQLGGVGLSVLQGSYNLNGHLDRLTAGATVASNAVLTVSAGSELDLASGATLAVQAGGRLEVLGASGAPAKLSRQSGYYTVLIQSNATLAASQAIFEYLGANGVYVQDGGWVDPAAAFDFCAFRFGAPGGTALRLDHSEVFTAHNVSFTNNPGGGAVNVRKTLNQGQVLFRDATGAFAGAAFESDPYNHIDWSQGLLSAVALKAPVLATVGGQYDVYAVAAPTNASEPIVYSWAATDNSAVQHAGGLAPDKARFFWSTPGVKTIQVTASNQWGVVSATQAVTVANLRIAQIQRQSQGTNLVALLLQGTSHLSNYQVESTTNLALTGWTRVLPHGSSVAGADTNTTWLDYPSASHPLDAFSNVFYRVKVLPPNDIAR